MSFDRNARSTEDVELRAIRAAVEHQAKSVLITSLQAATRGRLSPETVQFAEKVYKRTLIELVAHALLSSAYSHNLQAPRVYRDYKKLCVHWTGEASLLARTEKWLDLSNCAQKRMHMNRAKHLSALWETTEYYESIVNRFFQQLCEEFLYRCENKHNYDKWITEFVIMEGGSTENDVKFTPDDTKQRAITAALECVPLRDLFERIESDYRGRIDSATRYEMIRSYKMELIIYTARALAAAARSAIKEGHATHKEFMNYCERSNKAFLERVSKWFKYCKMSTSNEFFRRAELLSDVWAEKPSLGPVNHFFASLRGLLEEKSDEREIWKFLEVEAPLEQSYLTCQYDYDIYLNIVEECLHDHAKKIDDISEVDGDMLFGNILSIVDKEARKFFNSYSKNLENLGSVLFESLKEACRQQGNAHRVCFDEQLGDLKLHVEIDDENNRDQTGLRQFLEIRYGCALTGKPLRSKWRDCDKVLHERRKSLARWMKMIHFLRDTTGVPPDVRCDSAVEQLYARINAIDRTLRADGFVTKPYEENAKRLLAVSEIAQFDPIVLPLLSRLRMFTRTPEFDSEYVQFTDRSLKNCRLYEISDDVFRSLDDDIWNQRGVTVEYFVPESKTVRRDNQICPLQKFIRRDEKRMHLFIYRWHEPKPVWKPSYFNRSSSATERVHSLVNNFIRRDYDSNDFYTSFNEASDEEALKVIDFLLEEKEAHYIDKCIEQTLVSAISEKKYEVRDSLDTRVAAYEFIKDFVSCALKGQRAYRMVPSEKVYMPGLAHKLATFLEHQRVLDPPVQKITVVEPECPVVSADIRPVAPIASNSTVYSSESHLVSTLATSHDHRPRPVDSTANNPAVHPSQSNLMSPGISEANHSPHPVAPTTNKTAVPSSDVHRPFPTVSEAEKSIRSTIHSTNCTPAHASDAEPNRASPVVSNPEHRPNTATSTVTTSQFQRASAVINNADHSANPTASPANKTSMDSPERHNMSAEGGNRPVIPTGNDSASNGNTVTLEAAGSSSANNKPLSNKRVHFLGEDDEDDKFCKELERMRNGKEEGEEPPVSQQPAKELSKRNEVSTAVEESSSRVPHWKSEAIGKGDPQPTDAIPKLPKTSGYAKSFPETLWSI